MTLDSLTQMLTNLLTSDNNVRRLYDEDALLVTPLGRYSMANLPVFLKEFATAFPGTRASVHEAWQSPDGSRAFIRTHLQWRHLGNGFGRQSTGKAGDLALTHALRLKQGRIIEHVLGFSSFSLPQLLMVDWSMGVRVVDDPAPEIVSAAPGDSGLRSTDATLGQKFARAFGAKDIATLQSLYDPEVTLYTPLGWPLKGWQAVGNFVQQFHTANPGMRVSLHDEFSDGADRICWRINLLFHNTGSFYGHPPTGDAGTMLETHGIVVENGRIKRQIVGDGGLQLPKGELVDWKMPFPTDTPDPDPIVSGLGRTK